MLETTLVTVLADAGMVGIFVLFVLYLNKGYSTERTDTNKERKLFLDALVAMQKQQVEIAGENMTTGIDAINATTAAIQALTASHIALTQALAVHDVKATGGFEALTRTLDQTLQRFDHIAASLKTKEVLR